jgi:hypothetical protein
LVLWSFGYLILILLADRQTSTSFKDGFALALVLEVATTFWWLLTFALIAHGASSLSALSTELIPFDNDHVPYFEYYGIDNWKSPMGATIAAAVLGAAAL